jgi:hypothetical protein
MSKESYARGFCKAAEAHGVDPVALAKYAQWAPKNVAELGTDKIPQYHGDYGDSFPVRAASNPIEVSVGSGYADDDTYSHLRSLVDPKFKKWWTAHTNALEQAAKPVNEVIDSGVSTSPTNENWLADHKIRGLRIERLGDVRDHEVMKNLAKIYHDSMAKSTGAVSRAEAARIASAKALRDVQMARPVK